MTSTLHVTLTDAIFYPAGVSSDAPYANAFGFRNIQAPGGLVVSFVDCETARRCYRLELSGRTLYRVCVMGGPSREVVVENIEAAWCLLRGNKFFLPFDPMKTGFTGFS